MKISEAKFAGSSTRTSGRPAVQLPEIAFIGRSNVGKSSLINMLVGNKKLAMTSSTPGKTKLVNHFQINGSWYIVDLPGYGYAKLPAPERKKLAEIVSDYLSNSEELKLLFVLIDCRHDLTGTDEEFLEEVYKSGLPFAIIFTKGDKMGPVARETQIEKIKRQFLERWTELPMLFVSSAQTGLGKDSILDYIEMILNSV